MVLLKSIPIDLICMAMISVWLFANPIITPVGSLDGGPSHYRHYTQNGRTRVLSAMAWFRQLSIPQFKCEECAVLNSRARLPSLSLRAVRVPKDLVLD